MDAISFVLGVRTPVLRGGKLKDLIHRKQEEEVASAQTAFVEIAYINEDGEEMLFRRSITKKLTSQYSIDGKTVK